MRIAARFFCGALRHHGGDILCTVRMQTPEPTQPIDFTCNLCGGANTTTIAALDRELPSCKQCGSTVRMRGFVLALSDMLFGRALVLSEFPAAPHLRGIGLSDWDGYAKTLAQRLNFCNTYFNREPRLDITRVPPALHGTCDFITSNDVFEHVVPPVAAAFDGAHALLKPGGALVLCVPFAVHREHTLEHFPDLHAWVIRDSGEAARLHNRTRDGREQVFDALKFHGGEGATLEMRIFSRATLGQALQDAGFVEIRFRDDDALEWGVYNAIKKSLPVTARRPLRDDGSAATG